MSTAMRVRELSAELGVSNKELIHILRQENIQVKSHMSGLNQDQVDLVRSKMSSEQKQEQAQDTLTSSGVIVRRRKKAREDKKPAQEEARDASEQESRDTQQPPAQEEAPSQQEQPQPVQAEAQIEAEEPTAAQEAAPEEAEETDGSAPAEAGQEEAGPETPAEAQQAPEAKAPAEKPEQDKKSKRRKKGKKKASTPSVTIISRPEQKPEPEPEAEAAPAAAPDPAAQQPETKPDSRKKGKKDKRVVDVSGLYEEKEQHKGNLEVNKGKRAEVKGKTGGKPQRRKKPAPAAKEQKPARPQPQPVKASKKKIRMEEAIRVSELAQEMGVKAQDIIKTLLSLGVMANINQSLDLDTATLVAAEFGYEVEDVGFSEEEFILPQKEDKQEELQPRPPVVTIMGHVDHGKTSLLDSIRKSHVTSQEAGGITQHIGAYHVQRSTGSIVFLDTPGHEAFTEMRSRGAQVTDIVILIVAADDGVMDQTKEAINHAKAAGVPIVVAINKIDKDNADLEMVKRELADQGLISEEWGGDTIFCNISAKNRIGLDQLLEMVLLQAEMLELQANPNKRARGHIVESKLDKGRGPVGTVLIQEGTLRTADAFVCGLHHGKVRALFNDTGTKIDSAGPAMPVEVQGFEGVPNPGDEFVVVESDKLSKRIAEERQSKHREKELAKETKVTLESFFAAKAKEEVKTLNLILKADVHGSLEAVTDSVHKLSTQEVKVNIVHGGIGAITESDIKLANASSAVLIGFNVRPTSKIKDIAEQEAVEIRFYNVIYQLVSDVKEAMAGMLEPVTREIYLGQAEVRETFNVPKAGTVAGCFVLDGKLKRNAGVRLLRDGIVIYTGKLSSLKRFKDDVKEVSKDYECGAGLQNFNDIKTGDIIEAFEEVQEKASLQ
ncbi:MAG: translation initiation factor IF-2 [Desulfohalobiaceae bacterium]